MTHPAVADGKYDIDRIRTDFPILSANVYGKPLVYLDNAASAQKPRDMLDRSYKGYTTEYANVHRGLHFLANAATEAYEGSRDKVQSFLNAPRRAEIIFTRNATEAINLVAATFGRMRIQPGDEIVLSIMEHHSNIVPWHFLRERHGAVIKWAPVDDDGNFLIDDVFLWGEGVRDFDPYRMDPSAELYPDFFVPDDAVPPPGVTLDAVGAARG